MNAQTSRRARTLLFAAMIAAGGIAAGWVARGSGGTAEAAEDDTALAETVLDRFYETHTGKVEIADVLGDAFQVMRTDGKRYDRAGYVARHPMLSRFKLTGIKAIRSGDILTVSYFAAVDGEIEGVGRATGGD